MKAKERPIPATRSVSASNGAHADLHSVRAAAFAWEDWFRQATTAQQAEALAMAQRQGYVYAHQLPAPSNGATQHSPTSAGDGIGLLRALLAGTADALPAVRARALEAIDRSLTHAQRQAVGRVAASPDLALLRARPGQSAAVLAEVVTQAARSGQRVLLLAQQPANLDQVLARLLNRDPVLPVRFLDAGENVQQLPTSIRACTLDAQRQLFQSSTLAKAQTGRVEAEQRCHRRHEEDSLWPQLHRLARQLEALDDRRRRLRERLDNTPGEVRREAAGIPGGGGALPSGPFALQIVELIKDFNQHAAVLDKNEREIEQKQADLHIELQQLDRERNMLGPLADAKQRGRWWTGAWWRATFTKDLPRRLMDAEQRRAAAQSALAAADADLEKHAEARRQRELRLAADRDALVAAESERRANAWTAQLADVEREQQPLTAEWLALLGELDPASAPAGPTHAAVAQAEARWQEAKERDEAACLFARQWASFLQESAPQFIAQLPRYASLLAGTVGALANNREFAAFAEVPEGPFDLVVIDQADRLLENDLLRLARMGRRWLLVGHPWAPANGRASSFDKLWQTLHADPAAGLAYRWGKESNRWCCQLRPVHAKDRPYLETERLADFPEIELRILALPKAQPHLAQVVFPASMTLAQAKGFIHGELQEAAVQPAGRGAWLEECPEHWALHLGGAAHGELVAIDLEPGVREWSAANGLTHRVEFAKPAWSQAQVDEWMRRCLNLRDVGRTFELT